jgi:hypothetical protein
LGVVVLLLLAVIWAAVLIPPMVRARAESRPSGSITDFRRQLRVLARATPNSSYSAGFSAPVYSAPLAATGVVARRPAPRRRTSSVKRRRDILVGLLVAMAGSLLFGVLPPLRVLWLVHVVLDVLFVAYVALLVYMRNLAAERDMKVRFLPTAAPRSPEPALLLRRSGS